MTSATTQPMEAATPARRPAAFGTKRFTGKRVAMVMFSTYPADPRPRRAIDALVAEGACIDLICLESDGAPRQETLPGVNVHRVALKHPRRGKVEYGWRYGLFILISALRFAIGSLARRYDLVYVHNMPDILVIASLIPKAFGAKVVLDLHDPMPELMMTIFGAGEKSASVRLLKGIEKWSIGQTDLAITVNRACERIFSSRSCSRDKIAVVMNAPDGEIFPFREPQPRYTAEQAGKRPFVIMYHGSLVERNGLDVAVDALWQIRDAVPAAELRIFGPNTPFLEKVMATVKERKLEGMVRYLGGRRLEDLVSEIEGCDLGVIPNHRNAFTDINTPTRIFEYLALGKPVIAPSTLGIQDYFDEGSLLFFEPGNSRNLAEQIAYAYSHPREILEVARRGQAVYRDHTWERERETLLGRIGAILNEC